MARCTELDNRKLSAIVHALRPHISSSNEATKCATHVFRNRSPDAIPEVSLTELMHFHWRPGGRMQNVQNSHRGPGSNGPACTGRPVAPTPSSPSAAPNSADALRSFGNVGQLGWPQPRDFTPQIWSDPMGAAGLKNRHPPNARQRSRISLRRSAEAAPARNRAAMAGGFILWSYPLVESASW
jgi:hypothetical protein